MFCEWFEKFDGCGRCPFMNPDCHSYEIEGEYEDYEPFVFAISEPIKGSDLK